MHSSHNKQKIIRSFNKAAQDYDQHSNLQKQVGNRLLKKISSHNKLFHKTILDLGCGTGYLSKRITQKHHPKIIFGCDIAEKMCQQAQQHVTTVCSDAELLAITNDSIDYVASNLALQWCQNHPQTFNEISRVLKPKGRFYASTFGPKTLQELKHCWELVDDRPHVNSFSDAREIQNQLKQHSFTHITITREILTYFFSDFKSILHHQKNIGANVTINTHNHLTGKHKFKRMQNIYKSLFSLPHWRTTYEIFYITAEKKPGNRFVCNRR